VLASGADRPLDDLARHVCRTASRRAYEIAGIGPEDVSVAEVHDATAFGEILQIENLGFCEPGLGGVISERGETSLGGRIPVNPSGGLESKGEMKMGLREGPWEMFHANGKKKAVESYKNGVADGHWVSWYENGQIEADANYKNGLAVGTERHWYENGQSSSEGEYVLGYAEGRHLSWHENGKIAVDGSYKRGRRDGEFKEFAEDGSLWRTQTWVQGDFVSEAAPN
jgi:antitoxin component YwqK of YwqJK toxin-antitoxin module